MKTSASIAPAFLVTAMLVGLVTTGTAQAAPAVYITSTLCTPSPPQDKSISSVENPLLVYNVDRLVVQPQTYRLVDLTGC